MSQPQETPQQPVKPEIERYRKAVHNAALAAVIACPILAILPPRKLDIYTLGLVGVTGYSANYLIRESSGRSVWQHVSRQPMRPLPGRDDLERQEQSVIAELQKEGRGELAKQRDVWKVQRQREIKEDVEEGKGFADMIMDQIWEVWNQGKVKEDEDD
ncbi:hypothetical protein CLAFUW4_02517 [Fulvia fulva]|nr:hypothetical protein CLAFUR4_02512 [Fulvia fulva]KAK4633468.1 hypothetical protein CLAFUR0_02516 [Fulvia fulva]WPV11760.1 hypothetical protein CLAFUW4_02517 [Fulvia fulva]WPV25952.1 hypothetical protein CLAFUW7_02517 [Fulvia fulva]